MQITRNGLDTTAGPDDWFAGDVYIDVVSMTSPSSRVMGGVVHFAPGARTAWHTHPVGQTIFVTEGVGLCQREGGPVEEVRPGDVVWFPPGEKHWHGAGPTTMMSHMAITEVKDGGFVTWMEKVADEQYKAAPG